MERSMKKSKLPKTDSIQKLAEFWDTHDLTDFEDELEDVPSPVFVRGRAIKVHLEPREAEAVEQMAQANGISQEELIRDWVLQQTRRRSNASRSKRSRDRGGDYPFSKGERGKYVKRYAQGTNVVVLAPDIAAVFPNSESVNEALRALVQIARKSGRP